MATQQTSDLPLQAVSIRCGGCGAPFGVLPQPGQAICPYCQREQLVSAQMLGQLQQYQRAVQVQVAQAEAAVERAGAGQAFRRQNPTGRAKYVVIAVLVPQLLCVAVSLSSGIFHFPSQPTGTFLAYAFAATTFLVPLLWIKRRSTAQPAPPSALAMSRLRVACSNCGAVAEMVPGETAHRCPYCQTAIVASRGVIQHGV